MLMNPACMQHRDGACLLLTPFLMCMMLQEELAERLATVLTDLQPQVRTWAVIGAAGGLSSSHALMLVVRGQASPPVVAPCCNNC